MPPTRRPIRRPRGFEKTLQKPPVQRVIQRYIEAAVRCERLRIVLGEEEQKHGREMTWGNYDRVKESFEARESAKYPYVQCSSTREQIDHF